MSRVIGVLLCLLFVPPVSLAASAPLTAPVRGANSAAAPSAAKVILVFGDSLSAGYGLPVEQGWVNLLANRLRTEGYGFQVVNASVSGETTTGGLARLQRALDTHHPVIVILELGANDGLRGLPLSVTRSNLDAMLAIAARSPRRVLLLGMRMPPNYGERYTEGYMDAFATAARHQRVTLLPFFLEGVAGNPRLIQADGLHPNEQGQPLLLDNVWTGLQPLLRAKGG
jgi:acyl-CoA thioesterase I